MRLALACLFVMVAACASSKQQQQPCDPAIMTCDEVDAGPVADAPPDGPPKKGFGEPCTDNMQCDSGLCILVGTTGQCTKLCGECPEGYGCLGVEGIAIDGEVSFVCVPTSNQLCTPCTMDSECTLIGMDKCVTYPDGDQVCARDCTDVTCPTGYDCETVSINGTNYEQCMAASGACDCNAMNPGAMQPCNIMTPWNVCIGAQTCGGASGWGTCEPPSMTDDPDGTYTDSNCDGIDGEYMRGIFVAGGGANTATCGLTHTTPCQTVSHGVIRAVQAARQHVFVQAGTYTGVVVLVNGVNIWGGYDFNWQRGPVSNVAHRVTLVGALDNGIGGDDEWLAVRAHTLIVPVTLGDLVIRGPIASGTVGGSGKSSYAVHVDGANLTLSRVQLQGGDGASGGTGADGLDAAVVDAQGFMFGGNGGNGSEFVTTCNDSSHGGGGGGGTNSCAGSPSTRAVNGGSGGAGGEMDSDCSFPPDFDNTPGDPGGDAAFVSGAFGQNGGGGPTCGNGGNGAGGLIANGAAGSSGGAGGTLTSGYWYGRSGNNGGTGQNGSGGGGGGGSGGCDDGTDAYGAGGSGGGAGGCAARGGGGGGGGGGASIALFVTGGAVVTTTGCDVTRGVAGNGGAGGRGGRGQSGGSAGAIGSHPGTGAGGVGGNGAHGGHGGGGGGGSGGRAMGIGIVPGSTVNHDCTITGGGAGTGGTGGLSAPFAPLAERDGNNGANGAGGTLDAVRTCASATSC
jgi:hypothetical protein